MVGGRPSADQQDQRIDEEGFPGAGFTGQNLEARIELKGEMIDEAEVCNSKLEEHRRRRLGPHLFVRLGGKK